MHTRILFKCSVGCLALASLLLIAGCGGSYQSSAYGTVTLDGKVVPRGNIAFQPLAGGPAAYAQISEDGSYVVQTGREGGLPAGDYLVSVTANEAPAITQGGNGGPPPPGKLITPVWYRSKETSGLKYTVQPGKNVINLELKSQPPAGWKGTGRS